MAADLLGDLQRHRQAWPERAWTDARGHAWRWRDSGGAAPLLLLLPGAGGSADVAFALADALAGERRVVSITCPAAADCDALADGLAGLIDTLGGQQAHVWASSYGAWWAQAFAMRHPQRLSGLWLGNGFIDGDDLRGLALFDRQWLESGSAEQVQAGWIDAARQRPEGGLRDLLLEMIGHSLAPQELHARLLRVASARRIAVQPDRLDCPVVVAHCEDDAIIRASTRARCRQAWPDARHLLLPAGGHYPHVTHLPLLLAPLRAWLQATTNHAIASLP